MNSFRNRIGRMRVIDNLVHSIRSAAVFNPEVQDAPVCILWPDRERQWEGAIPVLQSEMPDLLILGEYLPEKRMGPAIWLRCAIAGRIEEVTIPADRVPVIYLPGVGRQDLRAIDQCDENLKPIVELQYRGATWSQMSSKDWTILAFLKSQQGGLGLDVASDADSKVAMKSSLRQLLDHEVQLLRGKRLDKEDFHTLLSGDPIRDLLQWIDNEESFRASRTTEEWQAFVEICKSQRGFDPGTAGVLSAAEHLASRSDAWKIVFERFREGLRYYPNIPNRIRQCKPPNFELFDTIATKGGWPQWNDSQEDDLRKELCKLDQVASHIARQSISDLERRHGLRRALVWADLGESPLAQALSHLSSLAEITKIDLAVGTVDDVRTLYEQSAWKADDLVLRALQYGSSSKDCDAIMGAIRSIYLPWLESAAHHLQAQVDKFGYPSSDHNTEYLDGDCILFVDGLRYDIAQRLIGIISKSGHLVEQKTVWSALPSVTATAKPAVTPVRESIIGLEVSADFEPSVADTEQSLRGGYHLKKLLKDNGWILLDRNSVGDGSGRAWTELGDIDQAGHTHGWKISRYIDRILKDIEERVLSLLSTGWKRVHVVTDHGWLLVPGGLPKTELSSMLTENKWGRCASLKPGSVTDLRVLPWYWNPNVQVVMADGISCFKQGEVYTHGGLSVQECLTQHLIITSGNVSEIGSLVTISDVRWRGLRCSIGVEGIYTDLSADIRKQPGNPSSSVVLSVKSFNSDGAASLLIEDEDMVLTGTSATLVLLNQSGQIVAQQSVVIGG